MNLKRIFPFIFCALLCISLTACFGETECKHTYSDEVIAPTCTAEGYTKHTCLDCSHTYNDATMEKTHHRFNGAPCHYCGTEENNEAIVPDTEWYSPENVQFTITTAEQLAGLAALVNEGTDFASQVIYLEADVDLGYKEWIPIGNAEQSFKGTFNGNGHVISGLKIHAETSYVGLFGNNSGNIFDFTVANATVYQKDAYENISIVCGYSCTAITGVSASGFIDTVRSKNVGAIAGQITAQISKSSSSAEANGAECVGGIAGKATLASAVLSEITNTGAVSGGVSTGGLIGDAQASGALQTDKISNTGDVTGTAQVGGIFGIVNAKVGSSVYGASVFANISGEYCVGGIVGKTESVSISHCTNEGSTVSASSYYSDGTFFRAYLGGYVGYGYSVDNCVNTVEINYNARGTDVGGIAGILMNAATNCENTANVTGFDSVGGISGAIYTNVALNVNNLKNSGNISGNATIGGIVGCYGLSGTAVATTLTSLENSGTIIGAAGRVAGIIGFQDNKTGVINASHLKNTGDVTGGTLDIGGLFGYVIGANSSVLQNSSSSANIIGNFKVGGLVGVTATVAIKNCSNEGTTVTAKGWQTIDATDYAWLGGYAGQGYTITGCTNNADITYNGTGIYVGGIVGYTTSYVQDCTNNGNITAENASHVGGIAGMVTSSDALTFKNLKNIGDICGKQRIGGIIGSLYQATAEKGTLFIKEEKGRYVYAYCSYHRYKIESKIQNAFNSGAITAKDEWGYVGGIVGLADFQSTYFTQTYNCCKANSYTGHCHHIGYFTLATTDLTNTGMITGKANVGELMGYHKSDGEASVKSSVTTYTVLGKTTVNGEVTEGDRDVGYTTNNLTLSGRELYAPEKDDAEE